MNDYKHTEHDLSHIIFGHLTDYFEMSLFIDLSDKRYEAKATISSKQPIFNKVTLLAGRMTI